MAKSKQKDQMPAGIRNKLVAAICMLMVSCIMLVTATYAWFTLSTAPEVKNIETTVAGNGSLEIALMPTTGLLGDIKNGNAGILGGGSVATTEANITWGNLVSLEDESYGLANVSLLPASLNSNQNEFTTKPLTTVEFGNDGRPYQEVANTEFMSWDKDVSGFSTSKFGVRAIGTKDATTNAITTYGYVVDLAVRLNTTNGNSNGKLLLQTDAAQRIYSGSTNSETEGNGSYMSFAAKEAGVDLKGLMSAIRVTFVKDYGKQNGTMTVLGTAKLDTSNIADDATEAEAGLYLYKTVDGVESIDTTAVLIDSLEKNAATQISAIVWLDGTSIKNGDVGTAEQSLEGQLNLQFTSDVVLIPAENSSLMGAE